VISGIAAVGAPVYDHSVKVVAAISLSGLSSRYGPEHISDLAQIVTETADRFSRELGHSRT
jgi:DNA-binding IclR family transcriptional regulator